MTLFMPRFPKINECPGPHCCAVPGDAEATSPIRKETEEEATEAAPNGSINTKEKSPDSPEMDPAENSTSKPKESE